MLQLIPSMGLSHLREQLVHSPNPLDAKAVDEAQTSQKRPQAPLLPFQSNNVMQQNKKMALQHQTHSHLLLIFDWLFAFQLQQTGKEFVNQQRQVMEKSLD